MLQPWNHITPVFRVAQPYLRAHTTDSRTEVQRIAYKMSGFLKLSSSCEEYEGASTLRQTVDWKAEDGHRSLFFFFFFLFFPPFFPSAFWQDKIICCSLGSIKKPLGTGCYGQFCRNLNECDSLSALNNGSGQRDCVNLAHGQNGWVRSKETTPAYQLGI